MDALEAIQLFVDLVDCEDRESAKGRLAAAAGAEDLLVFLGEPGTDAMLPAPGWRKTLPGGEAWRGLLARARLPGVHRGMVPWERGKPDVEAVGCVGDGVGIVLIGGSVCEADAQLLCAMAPLLKGAFRAQQALAASAGELQAARSEVRHVSTLMMALDETRAQLDRSLSELDRQARSLEQARHRAEQATRSKDEFMAMLGHELRNPLAPIKTALDLLKFRGVWSQEHEVMQRQLAHMIRLVDDLLDVARIVGGKLSLQLAPVEIGDVVARALETASPLLTQRAQSVCVDVPPDGLLVHGEGPRLEQVFANLLTNASKYSDPRTHIDLVARREGDSVRIEVRDQGIGIDASLLEDVFELFNQQGRGLDRAQGGLGLGLAIVRNLVALHQGTVAAYSDGPGRGSRFVVTLPLMGSNPAPVTSPNAHVVSRSDGAGGSRAARILLVDDNADGRDTLALALTALGHEVHTAADAFEALNIAPSCRPDVAVLDIGLPVMDGYELANRLRELDGRPIRMIAVTGYGQPSDKARTRAAGFSAHFVKPVDLDTLVYAVERLAEDEMSALPATWEP
ncbi:MAG TPA: ATP-binding protein [Verrucomicrobiae bacterium]|nr:ATP-binding protein [Verrucomicrobiae bacterium]